VLSNHLLSDVRIRCQYLQRLLFPPTFHLISIAPECRLKSGHKNSKQIVWKCVTVQIIGDDSNKSKLLIQEEIKR
jgi:hypothetical protein